MLLAEGVIRAIKLCNLHTKCCAASCKETLPVLLGLKRTNQNTGLEEVKELLKTISNRPLSRSGHFESQGNKKLCFCTSSLALNERLDVQNLLFEHCVIKVYYNYCI